MKNMTKCFLVTFALVAGSFHCGWAMQVLSDDEEELLAAFAAGNNATIARLLVVGVNVKTLDGKRLLVASAAGDSATVARLLDAGVNVNAPDGMGQTALMYATCNGRKDIVRMLLDVDDIDVNAQDRWGGTALMNAAWKGHAEIVRLLLTDQWRNLKISPEGHTKIIHNAKADVNAQGKCGKTALMNASACGHIETVRTLLDVDDIDVNAQDRWGKTALMGITSTPIEPDASSLYLMCAIDLLKAGADITLTNKEGKTALDLARKNGNTEIVQLFERYLEAIRDCVADKWRDCPLEVINCCIMPFLDPDQK
jgi:ankyrin repeat protein